MWRGVFRGDEQSAQVYGDDAVILREREGLRVSDDANASVVDYHVQLPEFVERAGYQSLQLLLVGNVGVLKQRRSTGRAYLVHGSGLRLGLVIFADLGILA